MSFHRFDGNKITLELHQKLRSGTLGNQTRKKMAPAVEITQSTIETSQI